MSCLGQNELKHITFTQGIRNKFEGHLKIGMYLNGTHVGQDDRSVDQGIHYTGLINSTGPRPNLFADHRYGSKYKKRIKRLKGI